MHQRKKRGIGALMLGAGIWLTTFGCGGDDEEGSPAAGNNQGGAMTSGAAGRNGGAAGSGGAAGTAAAGEAQSGGAAGTSAMGGLANGGVGQGGTPQAGGAGQAGATAGDGGNATGGSEAGVGGGPGGAAGNGQAGEQGSGLVDCGGQSCDRCCYNPGIAPEIAKEFECDATYGSDVYLCGFMPRFEMSCDAKSDCGEGLVCCMEETKVSLLAVANCAEKCPNATSTWSHYELCANDEECTAGKHCLKIPNRYFRACQ